MKTQLFAILFWVPIWAYAQEVPRLDLEVFCDGALQPVQAQEWGAALNRCGFQSVQLRAGDQSDALDIRDMGGGYRVLGMLTRENKILLPGGQSFSKGQIRDMKPYLEEKIRTMAQANVEKNSSAGSPSETAEETSWQKKALNVLAEPVGFDTKGMTRRKVLHGITKSLDDRAVLPKEILDALDKEDCVTEELKNVSKGTALAYVLRYIGYCFVLEPPRTKQLRQDFTVRIMSGENVVKSIFPIGHSVKQYLPILQERFHANIDGARVSDVLDAMSVRLNLPLLYDYNSMAGLGIEPSEVIMKQKPVKISYDSLFDMVLLRSELQKEIRIDESGKPFLWITTFRPVEEER